MSSRDLGFSALGRFLAVEHYCETHQSYSTYPWRTPEASRTAEPTRTPGSSSRTRTAAEPRRR
jgi:hypothetical protein